MPDQRRTPVLTSHARDRCVEMGISTKVAKAIVVAPDITRPSPSDRHPEAMMAVSDVVPEYAVIYKPNAAHNGADLILTVLFRTYDTYVREGKTYRRREG